MYHLKYLRGSLLFGLGEILAGSLLYFGAAAVGGIAIMMIGGTIMLVGLILPGKLIDTGNTTIGLLVMFVVPFGYSDNRAWLLSVLGLLCVAHIGWALWRRWYLQQALAHMWQLAKQFGYEVTQIQQLALAENRRADYSTSEWQMTHRTKPQFYPNFKVVRAIVSGLQVGRMA